MTSLTFLMLIRLFPHLFQRFWSDFDVAPPQKPQENGPYKPKNGKNKCEVRLSSTYDVHIMTYDFPYLPNANYTFSTLFRSILERFRRRPTSKTSGKWAL